MNASQIISADTRLLLWAGESQALNVAWAAISGTYRRWAARFKIIPSTQYPVTNLKPVDTNGNIDWRSWTTGVGLLSEPSGRRISDRARSIRRLHNRVAILGGGVVA